MKTTLLVRLSAVLALLAVSVAAPAQQRPAAPAGYWNLETNLTTRDYTVVRFYDAQDRLVYEERLDNLCLDLSRGTGLCRRTARQLDAALQQALHQPASAPHPTDGWLAAQFGANRRVQRVYAGR